MIKNIIIILASIILENAINLYFSNIKIITPLFTLISIVYIYPSFKNNKRKFYIFSFVTGLIYDIFFTNFYILNSVLFLIISVLIYTIFLKNKYKLITILITDFIIIIFYNLLLYIVFTLFKYIDYSVIHFLYILKYFFVGNILYSIILYIFTEKLNYHN